MARVRFTKAHGPHGPGTVTDLSDADARAAVDAGAAEELHAVRLTADWRDGDRWFPAGFEHHLTADQLEAAREAGAVPAEDKKATHPAARKRAHTDKGAGDGGKE